MQVTCKLGNFKKAIKHVERVSGKHITLPILENILISTEQGMLVLSATNLEIGIISRIGAKVTENGSISVPAKILGGFLHHLSDDDLVILKVVNQVLQIKSGLYSADIQGQNGDDFPPIPRVNYSAPSVVFPFTLVRDIVSRVLISSAPSNIRPEFTGVNISLEEKHLVFTATDGFRLSEFRFNADQNITEELFNTLSGEGNSLIVEAQAFSELLRVFDDEISHVTLSFNDNQVFFTVAGVQIVSQLINVKYPDYRQIIPQSSVLQVTTSVNDLKRAVRVSSMFTDQNSGEVKFIIDGEKNEIEISSESHIIGKNKTTLSVVLTGDGEKNREVIFNPRYILDGLSAIPTQSVCFLFDDGSFPAVLRGVDEKTNELRDDFLYIVRPIRK